MRSLPNYLNRIGLRHAAQSPLKADLSTLALVMAAHSRAIAFENIDVVRGKTISIARANVETKLVDDMRGGYCWEQNTLLAMALEELGFKVVPLLCRVRWNKPDDSAEPNTSYTHFALKVSTEDGPHLADVGFAGTNSMAPVKLDGEAPQALAPGPSPSLAPCPGASPSFDPTPAPNQALPEGLFRVVDLTHTRHRQLQLQA